MFKQLAIIPILCVALTTVAAPKSVVNSKVVLNYIKQVKKTERHGDELYLSVTSYPTKGRAAHKRFPNHPLFWPGRHIDKIKDLSVWQGQLKQDGSVRLLISLIEQDSPPWNIDDEIGSVDLKLHNDKGTLQIDWHHPNQHDDKQLTVKSMKKDLLIEFSGHEQSYLVSLKIEKS